MFRNENTFEGRADLGKMVSEYVCQIRGRTWTHTQNNNYRALQYRNLTHNKNKKQNYRALFIIYIWSMHEWVKFIHKEQKLRERERERQRDRETDRQTDIWKETKRHWPDQSDARPVIPDTVHSTTKLPTSPWQQSLWECCLSWTTAWPDPHVWVLPSCL